MNQLRRGLNHIFLASVVLVSTTCNLAEAFETRIVQIAIGDGKAVPAVVYAFKASDVTARIVPAVELRSTGDAKYGLSVKDAATNKVFPATPGRWMLVTNGGLSGSRSDRPVGLLIADGKAVSLPSFLRVRGDPESACALRRQERYRFSGVLCVSKDGTFQITPLDQAKPEACQQAVQAGPLLIEGDGRVGVCPNEANDKRYRRTVVCTARDTVNVIITSDAISLYDLSTWLVKPTGQGGLGCTQAINLSGDTSSGAFFRPATPGAQLQLFGDGSFPQASLLVIQQNVDRK